MISSETKPYLNWKVGGLKGRLSMEAISWNAHYRTFGSFNRQAGASCDCVMKIKEGRISAGKSHLKPAMCRVTFVQEHAKMLPEREKLFVSKRMINQFTSTYILPLHYF